MSLGAVRNLRATKSNLISKFFGVGNPKSELKLTHFGLRGLVFEGERLQRVCGRQQYAFARVGQLTNGGARWPIQEGVELGFGELCLSVERDQVIVQP